MRLPGALWVFFMVRGGGGALPERRAGPGPHLPPATAEALTNSDLPGLTHPRPVESGAVGVDPGISIL